MKRCFVAMRIDDVARRELAALAEDLGALPRRAALKLRPVKAASLHLTLKFLGNTPDGQVPEVLAAMTAVAAGLPPAPAAIVGLGAFPSPAQPRIVFAALGDGRDPITALAVRLEDAFDPMGFPREERTPHPHVTLARVERAKKSGPLTDFIAGHPTTPFGAVDGSAIVLFESVLERRGAYYTRLGEALLQG